MGTLLQSEIQKMTTNEKRRKPELRFPPFLTVLLHRLNYSYKLQDESTARGVGVGTGVGVGAGSERRLSNFPAWS